jgi:hypothetical protein
LRIEHTQKKIAQCTSDDPTSYRVSSWTRADSACRRNMLNIEYDIATAYFSCKRSYATVFLRLGLSSASKTVVTIRKALLKSDVLRHADWRALSNATSLLLRLDCRFSIAGQDYGIERTVSRRYMRRWLAERSSAPRRNDQSRASYAPWPEGPVFLLRPESHRCRTRAGAGPRRPWRAWGGERNDVSRQVTMSLLITS